MVKRKWPQSILNYLGPCREPETVVEEIVEQLAIARMMGQSPLSDFDPLVVVMGWIADEIEPFGLEFGTEAGVAVWKEVIGELQNDSSFEHNAHLPCRYCDQAFRPMIDDELSRLFIAWRTSQSWPDLLAIHRCKSCGGSLSSIGKSKVYSGDMHTPAPGEVDNDEVWCMKLLNKGQA